jgi:hypothetical protein
MRIAAIVFAIMRWFNLAEAQKRAIIVASTTPTEQSGLLGYLLPQFSKAEGIGVKIVAVGTGQALDIGRRGDADVVFVHDRPAEDKFMTEGQGVKRGFGTRPALTLGPRKMVGIARSARAHIANRTQNDCSWAFLCTSVNSRARNSSKASRKMSSRAMGGKAISFWRLPCPPRTPN